ncbi:hypothetical protein [Atopobacter phocae]|uniref:hypothetical protein n=1 Tax=Atopobacter phocae TaxID=136492 RepID=UPI000470D557|nr:hypothetical protein [Atopobacter phocae]
MILYYATDNEGHTQYISSEYKQALDVFNNTLQKLQESKDYIDIDSDFAYLYKFNSYDLLEKTIDIESPYFDEVISECTTTLIKKRGWEIDEEATKEYLEETDIKDREWDYICREVVLIERNGEKIAINGFRPDQLDKALEV